MYAIPFSVCNTARTPMEKAGRMKLDRWVLSAPVNVRYISFKHMRSGKKCSTQNHQLRPSINSLLAHSLGKSMPRSSSAHLSSSSVSIAPRACHRLPSLCKHHTTVIPFLASLAIKTRVKKQIPHKSRPSHSFAFQDPRS